VEWSGAVGGLRFPGASVRCDPGTGCHFIRASILSRLSPAHFTPSRLGPALALSPYYSFAPVSLCCILLGTQLFLNDSFFGIGKKYLHLSFLYDINEIFVPLQVCIYLIISSLTM
jgi:hypothetical protein